MCAEDGLEDAELHPSEHEFRVGTDVVGLQVATAIVPPIAEADIGSRCCDVALELQGAVCGEGVARETNRVAMASHASPTVEDDGTTVGSVQPHVVVEDMIEPERLPKTGNVATRQVLLPIEPPEVHALTFPDTHDVLEEGAVESGILQLPGNGRNTCIESHVTTDLGKVIVA